MTPQQRVIIVVLVCLVVLGNITNFYIDRQKAIRYIEACNAEANDSDVSVNQVEQVELEDENWQMRTDGLSNSESDFDLGEDEDVVLVVRAFNADGTEHIIKECQLIHINWASENELQKLPGIGPVLAKRIVDTRKQEFFVKHEDLLRVSGIGVKKLEQIYDLICLAIPDVEK